MGLRRGQTVLASVALVGMGLFAPAAGVAGSAVQAVTAHPIPYAPGNAFRVSLSLPPTTAQCEAMFGLACYEPAQFQQAYDLQPLYNEGITGAGETIVIVDAFGSPTITSDLATFDTAFGLPAPPSFSIIHPAGAIPSYPQDPFGKADRSGWAFETTLDVEWSHVMAPRANILLVETPESETEGVQGFPQIVTAENYVIQHHLGDVISQSFGATEQTFEPNPNEILNLRSAYVNAQANNVTVLAASGDAGATDFKTNLSDYYPFPVTSWPPSDPLVTAVGGTQLNLDPNGNRTAPDQVWNDQAFFGAPAAGGGGRSIVFSRPAFQNPVAGVVGGTRGVPDISMSAAVNGAVDIFGTFQDYGNSPPSPDDWTIVGGTSEATPLFSGVVALADQAVGHPLGDLNPYLYSKPSIPGIVDVTIGNNTVTFCALNCGTRQEADTTVNGFNAVRGYDLSSGLGTIDGFRFVTGLQAAFGGSPPA
jgi:subtilase family serine protease